jgi:hypothetical protein
LAAAVFRDVVVFGFEEGCPDVFPAELLDDFFGAGVFWPEANFDKKACRCASIPRGNFSVSCLVDKCIDD